MKERCYFCKGELRFSNEVVDFRWGDEIMVVEGVPCKVCLQCGEKYLSGNVYKRIEEIAKWKRKRKLIRCIKVDVVAYS